MLFWNIILTQRMPISVFGSLDTSSFVQKLYLKLSFSEIKIAEHIEMEK